MSEIRRILVAVDFSEPSRLAFDYAANLGEKFGADVDVLHVWEVPAFVPPGGVVVVGNASASLADMVKKAAEEGLERFIADGVKRGVRIREAHVQMGYPAHTIVEAAVGYDLLVLGTHGRSGVSRVLLGSVAERVVRHAPCPVLTVRNPNHPTNS
jgi:nucleotide-binding universal stress UspA family protein